MFVQPFSDNFPGSNNEKNRISRDLLRHSAQGSVSAALHHNTVLSEADHSPKNAVSSSVLVSTARACYRSRSWLQFSKMLFSPGLPGPARRTVSAAIMIQLNNSPLSLRPEPESSGHHFYPRATSRQLEPGGGSGGPGCVTSPGSGSRS